ncbi:hypothetical protein VE25_09950 [Devosia geojensis]|uniref:PA14 domain-containing protein n=1 Tax=Devosia geojensis TaxID=443610 RepID=A0A0F5FTP9_9HYPH|nr:hypothetical protein [Devosia geojensis]KKB11960.1 hypothetical protein VE25_09950 [Devosia geojensis]
MNEKTNLSPGAEAQALFALLPGGSVTAWALSPIDARYYPGEPSLAEDRVDYHFINGFVDVGTLPCRIALFKELAQRVLVLQTDWPVESLNLPGANRRVEFTRFCHRPTRLSRWCRTVLVPPADGEYRFEIATCGGVQVWVDGVLQARFEPYTRNVEQRREIGLPLKANGSEVVVLTEEMAERDTNWFFELCLISPTPMHARLPGAVPVAASAVLEALAQSVRPTGEFVARDEPLCLVFDAPVPETVGVHVEIRRASHARAVIFARDLTLEAGMSRLDICKGGELLQGVHDLHLTFTAGGVSARRSIGCAILHDPLPRSLGATLEERKRVALEHLAIHGESRMGTALVLLATGREDDPRLRLILEETLLSIEERRDCSDFVMVPLLWAYGAWCGRLPADLAARTYRAVLDYRYWVDEPGNDVMWFWSENHVLCFHVSQLLAGRLFPEETFTASGRTGAEQARIAEERLGRWFDAVERDGLAEWNSAAYYPVDFIGLLALAELAPEPILGRARALTDRLFTMIALHTLGGVAAGSMGRAYDKELRAGPLTELAPFVAVAFGEGWLNAGVASLPELLLGRYAPPEGLADYVSPPEGAAIGAHYVQGHGAAGRLALYKTRHVQLSTTVDGRPGAKGHQQHLIDVRFAAHPFARAWVNHPGEDDPWGHQRPSYWAGNGVMPRVGQFENAALMLFDVGERARIDFTHAYVSAEGFAHRQLHGNWLIVQSGEGLAAFGATGPIAPVRNGPGAGREFRVCGRRTGWVVVVAEGSGAQAFAKFHAVLDRTTLTLDEMAMTLRLTRPDAPELCLSWHDGLSVEGKRWAFPNPTVAPAVTRLAASRFG